MKPIDYDQLVEYFGLDVVALCHAIIEAEFVSHGFEVPCVTHIAPETCYARTYLTPEIQLPPLVAFAVSTSKGSSSKLLVDASRDPASTLIEYAEWIRYNWEHRYDEDEQRFTPPRVKGW